jgi:hypothetical protein
MAERIVSPGVFTRERDLSFLPQGISQIGAAIVGPTRKGPSFVPTVITSFQEFIDIFGSYSKDYYTPYTVNEYLKSAGSVTVVRVGHLGGYSTAGFNLLATIWHVTASTDVVGTPINNSRIAMPTKVVATFMPSEKNASGLGSISGSIGDGIAGAAATYGTEAKLGANDFDLQLNGANATASFTGLSVREAGTTTTSPAGFLPFNMNESADSPSLLGADSPAYMYKFFKSSISESIANTVGDGVIYSAGRSFLVGTAATASIGATVSSDQWHVLMECEAIANMDFATGTETVSSDGLYTTTITGNSDTTVARTPFITSQGTSNPTDLFKVYMRSDGEASNHHYVVISDVKQPANSNSSPDYSMFSLALYSEDGSLKEGPWNKLNLDPDSNNYLVRIIGDQFQSVDANGEIQPYGDYPNKSKYIRIGDFDEDTFVGAKANMPMGYKAVLDPVPTAHSVPTASFNISQATSKNNTQYSDAIPYGFKIGGWFNDNELGTNRAYLSPIPKSETAGNNVNFALENMKGFGTTTTEPALGTTADASSLVGTYQTANEIWAGDGVGLSISSSKVQLKYAVPFQHGFDGVCPGQPRLTDNAITDVNTQGFDCSSAISSGSLSYKRAINAVSNPDDIDINMLVTPGVLHKLHSSVTNHAINKVEARADAFYVLDSSEFGATVATSVDDVSRLDSNYVATYYPWVKITNPDDGIGNVWVPPSVVIPGVIAYTDKVAHEWFAPAGLNRGGLSSVRQVKKKLTHTDRDTLYEGRVNPIASFPGQGVVVFGQKTLQAKPSALDRINVRRLLIKLKKFIASSSRFLVFEQNDSSTRTRFLNIVNPFLESVQSNSGLSAFKVVMDSSNNTPDVIDRNQLIGQIFIQPTRTAEFIVLDFTVLPTGAAFPE